MWRQAQGRRWSCSSHAVGADATCPAQSELGGLERAAMKSVPRAWPRIADTALRRQR